MIKKFTLETQAEFYKALLEKNSEYDGTFYVGVKTTGVFCRPTCGAKKPRFENCEFYSTAKEAALASFRPCKRCHPISHPNEVSKLVRTLVDAIEAAPEKKWKTHDLKTLSIDESTARRQFKKRFGMTFVEYARSRRIGLAVQQIRLGEKIIDAQLNSGYESGSGFRDAFAKIMGAAPFHQNKHFNVLKAAWFDTSLGPMIAIADENALYLLEFVDRRGLEREIERLRIKIKAAIIPGDTDPIITIQEELHSYFNGNLKTFRTPLHIIGTPFQKLAWAELCKIPYGETRSYAEQATLLSKPSAYRAVANANGANQIAIVIPCHRIINADGELGGYGGGVARKKWLIEHELGNK